MTPAFAVWLSGLPGAGKSTLAAALARQLKQLDVEVAIVSSAVLREPPRPAEEDEDVGLDCFYASVMFAGWMLTRGGMPVIFDTAAPRRAHREQGRRHMEQFLEVYLDVPLQVCMSRNFEEVFDQTRIRHVTTLAGIRPFFEIPCNPEVVVNGMLETTEEAASRIVERLVELGYVRQFQEQRR